MKNAPAGFSEAVFAAQFVFSFWLIQKSRDRSLAAS
jgi:hypothetical protein